MKFTIDKKIIQNTTRCHENYHCLEEGGKPCCVGKHLVKEGFLCISGRKDIVCEYAEPLGYRDVCVCPVRIEIFNKYHM